MKLRFLWCAEKRTKIILLVTVLLTTLVLLGGAKINALPERCLLCHSMKPEYYTWQASPHGAAKISCISCHSPPGIKGFFTAKARGFKEIYSFITESYVAPIKMKEVVADKACERCHSLEGLEKRQFADIKVSHQSHESYRVACVKCHTGLAHGQIADRKVTYASDYDKWDAAVGDGQMVDKQFTKPDMDVCLRCHRLREGPVACTDCHKNSKVPANHKQIDFNVTGHGRLSNDNIKGCDNCHRLMTDNKIEGFEVKHKFEEYLSIGKTKPAITAAYYSRVNKFCRRCHSKKPKSHDPKFISNHKILAAKSKSGCLTCHNNQQHRAESAVLGAQPITQNFSRTASQDKSQTDDTPPSTVACSSCHPALHSESSMWKAGYHPVQLPPQPKITRYCYYCHRETECSACHGKVPVIKITKEE